MSQNTDSIQQFSPCPQAFQLRKLKKVQLLNTILQVLWGRSQNAEMALRMRGKTLTQLVAGMLIPPLVSIVCLSSGKLVAV